MAAPLRPTPTHNDGEDAGPQSPEALFISALIEAGSFDPTHWHIEDDDLACFNQLWRFCCDHQLRAGKSPSIELLQRKYPEFEITPNVDPNWAAGKLQQAAAARRLRERMQVAIGKLKEDDVEGAFEAMDGLMVPVSSRRAPYDGFSYPVEAEENEDDCIRVPFEPLGRATGGIKPGDVWLFGTRLSHGKTTMACSYMATAVKEGWNCAYFSREMPAHVISHKTNLTMACRDKELYRLLSSKERKVREGALEKLRDRVAPGKFGVYDSQHGPCDPSVIRDALAEFDLVFIDHVELMTLRGQAIIRDWRLIAETSNKLKEETLRSRSRLFELVQINRNGDGGPPTRPPKLSDLSGTDHWGRDCDIGITGQRYCKSVMVHSAEKVRLGPGVKWYSRFDPENSRFDVISRDQAQEYAVRDEDAEERANR